MRGLRRPASGAQVLDLSERLARKASTARTPARGGATISEVAALTGATMRALRHYEGLGLVQPLRTRTRQRLYSPADIERLRMIVLLRALDLPIAEIAELLEAGLSAADSQVRLREWLHARADALEQNLRMLRMALRHLDARDPRVSAESAVTA